MAFQFNGQQIYAGKSFVDADGNQYPTNWTTVLSQEQKEQIYEIISGILIKNNQVKSMKLIEEDKKAIIVRNEKSKSLMIMEILIGKQKTLYEKKNSQITELKDSND